MIFDSLVKQVPGMLWYFLPPLIIIIIFKSSWFKGFVGEFTVNMLFKFFLDKNKYYVLKNVTLPTENGTTQIDHIVVSEYGVFVVETKNMKGWIFGTERQKQWTQKIYKYSRKFQNPLHQNYKHTKTLESCLPIEAKKIFSIVVFVGDSSFKTQMPDNVTYARGCIRYIKSKQTKLLSENEVLETILEIERGRLQPGFKTNRAHNAHVKEIVRAKSADKNN